MSEHPRREEAVRDAELAGTFAQRRDAVAVSDEHRLDVRREPRERIDQLHP